MNTKTCNIILFTVLLAFMTAISFAKDIDKATERHQWIEKRFVYILGEQWGVDTEKISGESYFLRDFGADSVDVGELVMALEDDFDIAILDEEWERITTVSSAVELILDKTERHHYRRY